MCVTWLSHPSLKCLQPNIKSEIVETDKHLCACMHVILSGLGLKECCVLKKEVNKTIGWLCLSPICNMRVSPQEAGNSFSYSNVMLG